MTKQFWLLTSAALLAGTASAQLQISTGPLRSPIEPTELAPSSGEEFDLAIDEDTAAQVDAYIAKLGSPRFVEREQASRGLVEIGAQAFKKLREAYRDTDDLEVRLRIAGATREGYFNRHVFDKNGFLGVTMAALGTRRPNQPTLPAGQAGILLSQVIRDSGASRAGLLKNDIVIAVNGEPIKSGVIAGFAELIRTHRPGSQITLTVMRNNEIRDFTPILGRCPEKLAQQNRVMGVSDLYRTVHGQFDSWWDTHFMASIEK